MYLITYRTGTISSVGVFVSSYCQLTYKYIKIIQIKQRDSTKLIEPYSESLI